MVVVYCLISFILGWRLSTWAKSEPFAKARQRQDKYTPTPEAEPVTTITDEAHMPELLTEEVVEMDVDDIQDDKSSAWFFDGTYLDDDDEHEGDLDATAQAQRYFIDNFNDETQLLSQRITALKAAISMNEQVLGDELIEKLYQILLTTDESHHPDDIAYMLSLLDGRVGSERLPGLAIYLKSPVAQVREESLKVIAPLDSKGLYRKHVDYILNNDPQTEVRALAFVMLEQHYDELASSAA